MTWAATPGFKLVGSSYWRWTAAVPGAPAWERLPNTVPADVTAQTKATGRLSAGLGIHIVTNADVLKLCWVLAASSASFTTWSACGMSGIAVYYRCAATGGEWKKAAVGDAPDATENILSIDLGSVATREFLIYLPSYRRLTTMRVEIPNAATLTAGTAPVGRPIVCFGSSLTHGSGTSHPGLAYTSALARHFDVDGINLGMSGNGEMIPGMATVLASVDASAYVLDCFPNMSAAQITANMYGFVHSLALNAVNPSAPIYIVDDWLKQTGGPNATAVATRAAKSAAAKAQFDALVLVHSNVFWVPNTFVSDAGEATFDNWHINDLGHWQAAEALAQIVSPDF